MDKDRFHQILNFAIDREQEAQDFYLRLAGRMGKSAMKDVFSQFAREESGHKARLMAIRDSNQEFPSRKEIQDLHLSDFLIEVEEGAVVDYQQALIVAMNREKAAFRLYSRMAEAYADDSGLSGLFLSLAQEEAKHKLRFEIECDDHYLQEN